MSKYLLVLCAVMALGAAIYPASGAAMTDASAYVTCNMFSVDRSAKSIVFHSTTVTIELDTSVCYNGREFLSTGETCRVAYQDPVTIDVDPCKTADDFYGWAPSGQQDPKGGYYSQATFVVKNCIFHWGCWSSVNITLALYITADGQYVKDDGR